MTETSRALKPWQVLDTTDLVDAPPRIRVSVQTVRLPDGRVIKDYYHLALADYALVYATTPDGLVVVERLYRHGLGRVALSLPAGVIDPGEDPLGAAARELLEETGFQAEDWRSLGSYVIHGNYRGCTANLFSARNAVRVAEPNSGDLEEMEILLMPPEELIAAVKAGEIPLLGTATAIALATNPLFA